MPSANANFRELNANFRKLYITEQITFNKIKIHEMYIPRSEKSNPFILICIVIIYESIIYIVNPCF